MINDVNFLLGMSYCLLTQVRGYLVIKQDVDGVELIEEQYQKLSSALEKLYYSEIKGKKDV
jgi:hypothetical protein